MHHSLSSFRGLVTKRLLSATTALAAVLLASGAPGCGQAGRQEGPGPKRSAEPTATAEKPTSPAVAPPAGARSPELRAEPVTPRQLEIHVLPRQNSAWG